jgi:glutamate-1-semialdehyde 2,1-aminomutase
LTPSVVKLKSSGDRVTIGRTFDLTYIWKIIGDRLPVGDYGGRQEIIETMAPVGLVYQARTLPGIPVAMTAGIETLKV